MLSKERFIKSAKRALPDRPPVWMMRQAGRHLPEYRAVKENHTFMEMVRDEEIVVDVTLQPWRRYRTDGVVVFADILLIPDAMGMGLSFTRGEGPQFARPIRDRADLKTLRPTDPSRDFLFLLNGLKRLRAELGDNAALLGFAGSPWTVMSYMTQSRDVKLKKEILERLTEETIQYLLAQIEAGVDCVQIFDSWGGRLSPAEYREWSLPYVAHICGAIQKTGVPVIIYIKESRPLLSEMLETGADIISIGSDTPLEEAKALACGRAAIQGNLSNELMVTASPDEVAAVTRAMLTEMKDFPGYIANLGHGLLPETPIENVAAFVDAVKTFIR